MHSLSIVVGPVTWALLYKAKEDADIASQGLLELIQGKYPDDCVSVYDDFGQCASLRKESISGWLIEDLDKSKGAYVARMLHNARTQAEAQHAAAQDTTIRRATQGPAVLSGGMMPGRFNG